MWWCVVSFRLEWLLLSEVMSSSLLLLGAVSCMLYTVVTGLPLVYLKTNSTQAHIIPPHTNAHATRHINIKWLDVLQARYYNGNEAFYFYVESSLDLIKSVRQSISHYGILSHVGNLPNGTSEMPIQDTRKKPNKDIRRDNNQKNSYMW